MLSTIPSLGLAVPQLPTVWSASVNQTTAGTAPGTPKGVESYDFFYDYDNKMVRHDYTSGRKAGYRAVYRYDERVPGETWSRAYLWQPGKEALCCFQNLCQQDQCNPGETSRMTAIEVNKKATDEGAVAGGEHWHHQFKIGSFTSNVQDWVVSSDNKPVSIFTNASIKGVWISEDSDYSNVKVGNLSEDDFAFPKLCTVHVCDASLA